MNEVLENIEAPKGLVLEGNIPKTKIVPIIVGQKRNPQRGDLNFRMTLLIRSGN